MFNVSLSDRLKAAVNTLEQTGSSLQARAIGQQSQSQSQSPSSTTSTTHPTHSIQSTPTQNAGPSIARSISPNPKNTTAQGAEGIAISPTRNYSTSQLAENALSGLRKSFQFSRDGAGHGRTASGTSINGTGATGGGTARSRHVDGAGEGQQELKDITSPTQPTGGGSSRPSSPAPPSSRFLSTLSGNFALGNDTPSVSVSATSSRPRSPNPNAEGVKPQTRIQLPPPNPEDPASYPLPNSPTTTANPLLSPLPTTSFADPLGASPSITPTFPPDPPVLEMQAPTPDEQQSEAEGGGEGSLSIETGAMSTETEVVQVVEEAAARYEGESRPFYLSKKDISKRLHRRRRRS